ncbi:hypothetical protein [Nocardia wallacei]|uniref:hypothetical protein n=1 Tax=Nocardia wallacei TaxID=480035 RepID=UPI002454FA5F|nr:hypothetical protein [Nocardia wallacei]
MQYRSYPAHDHMSLHRRYQRALDTHPDLADHYFCAQGYVWGWQDAQGPDHRDTHTSIGFACAYATHVNEFRTGTRQSITPVTACWQHWLTHGTLTGANATATPAGPPPLEPPRHRHPEAVAAYHRAHGYARGWHDATGEHGRPTPAEAAAFAAAYATVVAEFHAEHRHSYSPLDTSWQSWLNHHDLTAHERATPPPTT